MNDQEDIDLKLDSYLYDLNQDLIAKRPEEKGRDESRLLVYDEKKDSVEFNSFYNIVDFLPNNSLLVLNNSKVFSCRVSAHKETGAKAEVFFLNVDSPFRVLIKSSRKKKQGDVFFLEGEKKIKIKKVLDDATFEVSFLDVDKTFSLLEYLKQYGQVPIPPYIRNGLSDDKDKIDYQTLYAKELGSVAAPTAGLHFTQRVFTKLKSKNIDIAYVTLHVGLGTFLPVKVDNILEHKMHHETYFIEKNSLEKIRKSKKIFAVGTTSLRVLESMNEKTLPDTLYSTDIFLYPGVKIKSISGLITNFHLPGSSLLMLVSSLIGRTKVLRLYELAQKERFRFFSYGDSMLILLDK